ncbi:MAG: 23S rRNA (adenine(2030)-N(6))-methyltransferase RlmJ [Gammaproteobacteria bacterium]
MNYRHAFHAGNGPDVFKHIVLTRVLRALHKEEAPFCIIDTHAGRGKYVLRKGGEHEEGIGLLWPERAQWPAFADYLSVVAKFNGKDRLKFYPGSPFIIREFLRPQDRAVFLELHPEEHAALAALIGPTKGVQICNMDAWQGLKGFIPPKEERGLVLIDPPFEKTDDFADIAATLRTATKCWHNGIYMIWYPLKAEYPIARLHRAVAALGLPALAAELTTLPTDVPHRLNGSGIVLINPPWQLKETLARELPPLAQRLAGPNGTPGVRVEELRQAG